MLTLNGIFKGETEEKCNTLTLVYMTDSGIKIRIWVAGWLEIRVEEDWRSEGWVLHHREG